MAPRSFFQTARSSNDISLLSSRLLVFFLFSLCLFRIRFPWRFYLALAVRGEVIT
jgi:hypothetical protein